MNISRILSAKTETFDDDDVVLTTDDEFFFFWEAKKYGVQVKEKATQQETADYIKDFKSLEKLKNDHYYY